MSLSDRERIEGFQRLLSPVVALKWSRFTIGVTKLVTQFTHKARLIL